MRIVKGFEAKAKDLDAAASAIAIVYAGLGEKDLTFAWINKSLDTQDWFLIAALKPDPMWDLLRQDPRYGVLLKRVGLQP